MKCWLDRCESVCCPDSTLLSVDKIKLRNELQNVQVKCWTVAYYLFSYFFILFEYRIFFLIYYKNINPQEMQGEIPSYEALLQGLVNLGLCLYPTAPGARIQELSDDLAQLQDRCVSVKSSISHRQFSFYTCLHYADNLHLFLIMRFP